MSIELSNLIESIKLITDSRIDVASIDYAWQKLRNAEKYLQKQIAPLLAE